MTVLVFCKAAFRRWTSDSRIFRHRVMPRGVRALDHWEMQYTKRKKVEELG